MSSTNNTASLVLERCDFMGPFQWKDQYLTPSLSRSLVVTSVINGLSFPFIALLNAFFILCIFLKPNVRRKKSAVLMGYLAVTDLVVGVVVQPVFLASELCRLTEQCSACALDTAHLYFFRVGCWSSLLHVTLIAWERYIAIKHALQYKLIVTTKRLLAATIAAWLIALALRCIEFFHVPLSRLLTAITIPASFTVIVYFYIVIYMESKRHRRQIKASKPCRRANQSSEKEIKAVKTTVIIFGCLLICYAPALFAGVISTFILPANESNAFMWAIVYPWVSTLVMLNSVCNPCIYGWRVKEIRDIVAIIFQIFKCCSTNDTQQSIERIEMVELNRDGRLTNGSSAYNQYSRWNPSTGSLNDKASKQHKFRCKPAIPLAGIRDNAVDSASDLEPHDLFSKANSSKRERNRITVTAMVHMQPKPDLRRPEVPDEDGDTLPAASTKEIPYKTTITETASSFKCQEDVKKSGIAAAGLVQRKTQQEMNDMFPRLAAIIDKLEKEESDSLDAIREQNIEAERIDFLE